MDTADKISKIKLHKEVLEKSSLLAALKEKELDIKAKILETQHEAENLVKKAHEEAAVIKEKALKEGTKEGKRIFKEEIAKTEKEAQKIKNVAPQEIKNLKKSFKENVDKAVEYVLNEILPT